MYFVCFLLLATIGNLIGCIVGELLFRVLCSIGQSKKMGKSTIEKESEPDA